MNAAVLSFQAGRMDAQGVFLSPVRTFRQLQNRVLLVIQFVEDFDQGVYSL